MKLHLGKVWLEANDPLQKGPDASLCSPFGDHRCFFFSPFRVHVKMICNIAKTRRDLETRSNLRSGAIIINGFTYHDLMALLSVHLLALDHNLLC